MKRIRPLFISLPTLIPFIAWFWFDMAGIDYGGGNPFLSLRTAGWFILGFPFIVGLSYLLAWFTAAMYGRFGSTALAMIWLALIICLVLAIRGSLPQGRLAIIIGSELAHDLQIHRLISSDSFGDGTFTIGEFDGSPELLEQIVDYRSLREREIVLASQFQPLIDDADDYQTHVAYGDSRSTFFLSPKTGTIYFRHQSAAPPEP